MFSVFRTEKFDIKESEGAYVSICYEKVPVVTGSNIWSRFGILHNAWRGWLDTTYRFFERSKELSVLPTLYWYYEKNTNCSICIHSRYAPTTTASPTSRENVLFQWRERRLSQRITASTCVYGKLERLDVVVINNNQYRFQGFSGGMFPILFVKLFVSQGFLSKASLYRSACWTVPSNVLDCSQKED